jgi:signal transduction histidine kinase
MERVMLKQSIYTTLIRVFDASANAEAMWSKRFAGCRHVRVLHMATVPLDFETDRTGVWVLVPDSWTDLERKSRLLDMAIVSDPERLVMVIRDQDEQLPGVDFGSGTQWASVDESERSTVRTLKLLVDEDQSRHALSMALQFPADNPNPVVCLKPTGELAYANPAAQGLLSLQQVNGNPFIDALRREVGAVSSQLEASHSFVVDVENATYGFRYERDEVSGRVHGYGIDITANLDAERVRIEFEQQSRKKDEFLATMSHELRTPLNAILSCTEALREGAYGDLQTPQLEAVRTIRESGKHLLSLITDILDISKIEAGRLELNLSTLGVQAMCDSVLQMVRNSAEARAIELSYSNNADIDTFLGDPLRVKQILINLVGNAVKFTPEGGRVGLEIQAGQEEDTIAFRIWDTGPGISSENAFAIFKPFVQADGNYNRSQPGTGLGLAIAQHLAHLHEGDIALEYFDGPGAIFNVTLPIGEMCSGPVFDMRATGSWPLFDVVVDDAVGIETILIAEDTDSNYQHVRDLLVSLGYTVERAVDGEEAVRRCQELRPDIVLMDIDMPVMNGLDAIRLLRESPEMKGLPIIAVTAMAGIANQHACMSAGASAFLEKPYPLRDLMQVMNHVAQ